MIAQVSRARERVRYRRRAGRIVVSGAGKRRKTACRAAVESRSIRTELWCPPSWNLLQTDEDLRDVARTEVRIRSCIVSLAGTTTSPETSVAGGPRGVEFCWILMHAVGWTADELRAGSSCICDTVRVLYAHVSRIDWTMHVQCIMRASKHGRGWFCIPRLTTLRNCYCMPVFWLSGSGLRRVRFR
jgi:hypothetical protein